MTRDFLKMPRDFSHPKYDPYRKPNLRGRLAERFRTRAFFTALKFFMVFLILVPVFFVLGYDSNKARRHYEETIHKMTFPSEGYLYHTWGAGVYCREYKIINEQRREHLCVTDKRKFFIFETTPPLTMMAFLSDPSGKAKFTEVTLEEILRRKRHYDSNPKTVQFMAETGDLHKSKDSAR
jgi:hypothetical protein